ncbi:metal ABC transporter permease [Shimazuella sp. AN120528]|uniref:metal ABC transporter permease n=1 Tax=Shimazuella soli TaxID=1892854 RepID=UPI001F0ED448|nr:metal ABC transporter permease [Shimazuella soli]MCH5585006.1 metal ABC transporter permease [Shimazuella soli]
MITDFLEYAFLQHALIAGMVVGLVSPLVGIFLVVRRLSLIAEALSHITLSGVAAGLLLQKNFAFFAGISPLFAGMGFAVIGSVVVERIRQFYRSFQELAIPILLSGGIAIGVVLIGLGNGFGVDISGLLFGNILAINKQDLVLISIVAFLAICFIYLFFKELFALAFDEEHAVLTGIRGKWIHLIFMVMVAMVISVAIRVVGILLVSALMTLPVATSMQLSLSFRKTAFFSVLFAEFSIVAGLVFAYWLDIASGGAIVLVSIALLLLVIIGKKLISVVQYKKANVRGER